MIAHTHQAGGGTRRFFVNGGDGKHALTGILDNAVGKKRVAVKNRCYFIFANDVIGGGNGDNPRCFANRRQIHVKSGVCPFRQTQSRIKRAGRRRNIVYINRLAGNMQGGGIVRDGKPHRVCACSHGIASSDNIISP